MEQSIWKILLFKYFRVMEIKEDQSDFRKFWRIILFETSDFSELEKLHLTTYLESQKNQN